MWPARWILAALVGLGACVETGDLPPASAAPSPRAASSDERVRAETTPAVTRDTESSVAPQTILIATNGKSGPLAITVLGSSTAAGHGLPDATTSWVARYAAYLSAERAGSKVRNLAVGGYTTYHVLPTGTTNPPGRPGVDDRHNVTAALEGHPDAIIVNLPSNDAAGGFSVEETMTNLRTVAAKAKEAGVAVWVTTSQPRQLDARGLAALAEVRDRTRREFGAHAIDFFTPLAAADGTPLPAYNLGDGIHPNADGHRLLFEQVKRADLPAALRARR